MCNDECEEGRRGGGVRKHWGREEVIYDMCARVLPLALGLVISLCFKQMYTCSES